MLLLWASYWVVVTEKRRKIKQPKLMFDAVRPMRKNLKITKTLRR